MPLLQLVHIRAGDIVERYAQAIGGDSETPEHVSELLSEAIAIGVTLLKGALANQPEHLARLFGESSGGIQ